MTTAPNARPAADRIQTSLQPDLTSLFSRGRGRLAIVLASSAVVVGSMLAWGTASVWAWGGLGHKIAGQIADDRLTPSARKAVQDLLEPGESLATVSSWADQIRADEKNTSTWHYVNVPITEAKYDRKYEDAKGGVVSKVADFQKILADQTAPRIDRQRALKFLAHFLEDMHQPVHVGHRGDRGGNDLQVQYFDRGSNLHSVWDSGLLERAYPATVDRSDAARSKKAYDNRVTPAIVATVKTLEGRITPELAAQWSQGTVEDWANESLQAAKGAYLKPGTKDELRAGAKLGQDYYETNIPVAELRVQQAGVRLAALLNAIFP